MALGMKWTLQEYPSTYPKSYGIHRRSIAMGGFKTKKKNCITTAVFGMTLYGDETGDNSKMVPFLNWAQRRKTKRRSLNNSEEGKK